MVPWKQILEAATVGSSWFQRNTSKMLGPARNGFQCIKLSARFTGDERETCHEQGLPCDRCCKRYVPGHEAVHTVSETTSLIRLIKCPSLVGEGRARLCQSESPVRAVVRVRSWSDASVTWIL